jgi:hypothetical protein
MGVELCLLEFWMYSVQIVFKKTWKKFQLLKFSEEAHGLSSSKSSPIPDSNHTFIELRVTK